MKYYISVILVVALMFSLTVTSSASETINDAQSIEYMFEERFFGEDFHSKEYNPKTYYDPDYAFYDELYYHYNEVGDIDWALIYAGKSAGSLGYTCARLGPYVILSDGLDYQYGFRTGYGLYDVGKDCFFDISNSYGVYPCIPFDCNSYDGLVEAIGELWESSQIYLAGDTDYDGEVSVLDATNIQRRLAGLTYISRYMYVYGPYTTNDFNEVLADYDMDGEVSILDATAIQRWLAGLPNYDGMGEIIR